MSITNYLLDELKKQLEPQSDYNLAKFLGVSQQNVSKWRTGVNMSVKYALMITEELGLDENFIYISILLERAKSDRERIILQRMLENSKFLD